MRRLPLRMIAATVLALAPSTHAQKNLESVFREELKLTFILVPARSPEVFGVGAIIRGRGKNFWPTCYTDTCFPDKSKLLGEGSIKNGQFPVGRIQRGRVSGTFLNFLKLDYKGSRVRHMEIEFVDPVQEDIDLVTAARIVEKYLTPDGLKLLSGKTKPPNELIIMAVRCKKVILKLYDRSGREVMVPQHAPAGVSWNKNSDSSISLEDVWFGMRTAVLVKASSRVEPTPAGIVFTQPVHGKDPKSSVVQLGPPKPDEYRLKERKLPKGFIAFTSAPR